MNTRLKPSTFICFIVVYALGFFYPLMSIGQTLGFSTSFGASNYTCKNEQPGASCLARSGTNTSLGFYRSTYVVDSLPLFYAIDIDHYTGYTKISDVNLAQYTGYQQEFDFNKTLVNATLMPLYYTHRFSSSNQLTAGVGFSIGVKLHEKNRGTYSYYDPDITKRYSGAIGKDIHDLLAAGLRYRVVYQKSISSNWWLELGLAGYTGFLSELNTSDVTIRGHRIGLLIGLSRSK